eukprot:g15775.t1
MALEHELVKEAIVRADDCLRSICDSALDPSAARRDVRMTSIAVLKSTCFLASLPVRVKVAYFLGGVNGMLGLLQPPRDEAVLQVCLGDLFVFLLFVSPLLVRGVLLRTIGQP